ncbi:MAG: hypothetical protein F6J93_02060 [Oscillatoria sp. SIO1A7]|nr:hypothetical protein [Oscillatoria sp. SIO1A7]
MCNQRKRRGDRIPETFLDAPNGNPPYWDASPSPVKVVNEIARSSCAGWTIAFLK